MKPGRAADHNSLVVIKRIPTSIRLSQKICWCYLEGRHRWIQDLNGEACSGLSTSLNSVFLLFVFWSHSFPLPSAGHSVGPITVFPRPTQLHGWIASFLQTASSPEHPAKCEWMGWAARGKHRAGLFPPGQIWECHWLNSLHKFHLSEWMVFWSVTSSKVSQLPCLCIGWFWLRVPVVHSVIISWVATVLGITMYVATLLLSWSLQSIREDRH